MRLVVVFAVPLMAWPAFGQGAPLDKVYACAGITDNAARLVCFDEAVSSLKQVEAAGGVAIVNRAEIERAEKEAFGLRNPSLSSVAQSARASSSPVTATAQNTVAVDKVTLPVKSVKKGLDGRYRFTMQNGQVWRQTDEIRLPAIGRGPWQAEIRKAAIGTFLLKLDNRTAVRVKRVE